MINIVTLTHSGMCLLTQWLSIQRTPFRVLPNRAIISKREKSQTSQILSFRVLQLQTYKDNGLLTEWWRCRDTRSEGSKEKSWLAEKLDCQIRVVQKKGKAREGELNTQKLIRNTMDSTPWVSYSLLNPCPKVAVRPLALPLQINK